MAIVQMSSFSLLTYKHHCDALLKVLQRFGDVHLDQAAPDAEGFLRAMPARELEDIQKKQDGIRQYIVEIERFEKASRRLVSPKERKKLFKRSIDVDTLTFEELEARAAQIDIDALLGRMDEAAVMREGEGKSSLLYYIEPWENSKLPDRVLMEIRDAKPIIGTVAAEAEAEFAQDIRKAGHILGIVRKEKAGGLLFILKPSQEQEETAQVLAAKYHMSRRSARAVHMNREVLALQSRMDGMLKRRSRTDGSLEQIAQHKLDLMIYYEYLQNLLLQRMQAQKFVQTDEMMVVKGWMPTRRVDALEKVLQDAFATEFLLRHEPVSKITGDAPVLLENNRFTSAFEAITKMYATPRYNEVDPTPVFAPFYLLFFGMMLADVGYGIVMGLVMLLALKWVKLKPGTERMARFLFYLSFSTILWGFIYGSFFGGMIPLPALIDTNSEYTRVLIMAMGIGVVHLLTALGVKAYLYIRGHLPLYALFDVGFWYMVLLSGVALAAKALIPGMPINQSVVLWIMAAGALGILLTNGRQAKTAPGKLASGFYSLYGITNYVSDIVSYSRLMALGLAGGSIGIAINMMVNLIGQNVFLRVTMGAAIFVGGHLFNLFISGLSSYVHSCRLIYVEFFGKFYSGGGRDFTPMRAKGTYINIV